MSGNFGGNGGAARLDKARENLIEFFGIGRGHLSGRSSFAVVDIHRADESAPYAAAAGDAMDKIGGRGFAVRPRDSHSL